MSSSRVGPSGGMSGEAFTDDLPSANEKVKAVKVGAGFIIDSIQLVVESPNGTRDLDRHGGVGGDERTVFLDDDEFIIEVSGRYGLFVDSISIRTNKQTIHRFGGVGGLADYTYQAPPNHEIVGFHGREGNLLPDLNLSDDFERALGLTALKATANYIVALGVITRPRR